MEVKNLQTLIVNNISYVLNNLSEAEKQRLRHEAMHEKHFGHDTMHVQMFFIMIISLLICQFVLLWWKASYFKSYQGFTLFFMWIIPFCIAVRYKLVRFVTVWVLYTLITSYVAYRATRNPINPRTPRMVYKWFFFAHWLNYAIALVGYIILIATFLGLNLLFVLPTERVLDFALLMMFYGIYFGVLGRDVSEIYTGKMASSIGFYSSDGLPRRILGEDTCAICSNPIIIFDNERALIEKTYRIQCGHVFHEFCIRGWCIVGKKDTCPYCHEKVDTKKLFKNPWEKPHLFYGNFLDLIRYLLGWQPLIFIIVQGIYFILNLE